MAVVQPAFGNKGRRIERNHCKMGKLLTHEQLAEALGFKLRTIHTLRRSGKIPVMMIGHRTLRYDLDSVLAELSKREKIAGRKVRR